MILEECSENGKLATTQLGEYLNHPEYGIDQLCHSFSSCCFTQFIHFSMYFSIYRLVLTLLLLSKVIAMRIVAISGSLRAASCHSGKQSSSRRGIKPAISIENAPNMYISL
jgi:hypothetical protein